MRSTTYARSSIFPELTFVIICWSRSRTAPRRTSKACGCFALHNCPGHAHATRVQIRVHQQPHRLALSIQDDGQGFDVQQSKGLGLLGIEERLARLGGKCDVHSAPGSGTIVAVELPFKDGEGSWDARGKEENPDSVSG